MGTKKNSKPGKGPWWQEGVDLSQLDWTPVPSGELSGKQRGHLKSLAHKLRPVVRIGQEGITPGVISEIRKQLLNHELIKVKWADLSDEEGPKKEQARALAQSVGAHFVQLLGHIVVLYRAPDAGALEDGRTPKIQLP
ncbi:CRS1 / YhbY (CRM) domain-containing protein [Desulfacinum infernum DSM 9756]|uniref:CRS1 / YhbY (CRM) domain-containing protein n=1 Tax=Desulfacinum infernum DSM 9756 TaxID=1121391 RepID=A0A1M5ITU6_9BACT|nr:ribosome assembly RNA-binding protein YhbY [Desulfacinum infernum]SHG31390.1 CRS1 / YhbY (CRM) domain-containing protein [Desulfacinum infernum DSM 9756]